jgi:hypothetical protein
MYIKLTNGKPEPYSIGQLRLDNAQVSFPQEPSLQTLAEYGVYPVTQTSAPEHGEKEVVEDAGYLQLADSTWVTAWRVRPMTEQELIELALRKDRQRQEAYQTESDPLFFKAQRGEGTMEEWRAKIAEIKSRFPKG